MGTSIILLTFNKLEYTKKCIESIRKYTSGNYEIIVVDNNSTDGTKEWLVEQKNINCIFNKENVGFPSGCNIGINASKRDNDILLLNNDTVVTINYLDNLKKCLYSDETIGAVGPVSNSCPYYQTINVDYKNEREMHDFTMKYNKSDKNKWEQRQKLIGFCMLIKRKAQEKVGLLDEQFSPGNYEDDDYSIRLIKNGYKLYLCKDTFIHHYGSVSFSNNEKYLKILLNNEEKFKNKWGFTSRDNMYIYKNYKEIIEKSQKINRPKILELYCGTGSSAIYLNNYIDCEYYGYDINTYALSFLPNNFKLFSDLDNEDFKFDYVIISKSREFINDKGCKNKLVKYIDYKTKFILNLSEKDNNNEVIDGVFNFDKDNKYELDDGIKEVNVNSSDLNRYYLIFKNKKNYIEQVKLILQKKERAEFDIDELKKIIKYGILNENDFDDIISKYVINKVATFNFIAIMSFELEQYDIIIPLLNKAHNINKNDLDTIYNLSYVLNYFGQGQMALTYLNDYKGKSIQIDELISKIRTKLEMKSNEL